MLLTPSVYQHFRGISLGNVGAKQQLGWLSNHRNSFAQSAPNFFKIHITRYGSRYASYTCWIRSSPIEVAFDFDCTITVRHLYKVRAVKELQPNTNRCSFVELFICNHDNNMIMIIVLWTTYFHYDGNYHYYHNMIGLIITLIVSIILKHLLSYQHTMLPYSLFFFFFFFCSSSYCIITQFYNYFVIVSLYHLLVPHYYDITFSEQDLYIFCLVQSAVCSIQFAYI